VVKFVQEFIMASKNKKTKKIVHKDSSIDQKRALRRNQIIFGVIAVILILSMALSMVQF
jgi:hypothetical protein